jgi:hypothetical protein
VQCVIKSEINCTLELLEIGLWFRRVEDTVQRIAIRSLNLESKRHLNEQPVSIYPCAMN